MKTQHLFIVLAVIVVLFTACKKDDNSSSVKKEAFNGYAQKGPFVNGSSITISELTASLDQTGKIYQTIIANNSGGFEQKNLELVSRYVELKSDGFYFNEISGQISVAPMTLYALADIEDINSVNVNVLTHLEKPRVEYLVKQERMSFAEAKKQAQQEVLAIFGFEPQAMRSEELDLTVDAQLLAVSCILQGGLSTGDIMELMANINADIKEDGKLDNTDLGTKLRKNAVSIIFSFSTIRDNLTKKYTELGVSVDIPDFESYIQAFVSSDLYPPTGFITYPASSNWEWDNILSDHVTEVKPSLFPDHDNSYTMTANIPEGQFVKIMLKGGYWSRMATNWYETGYDAINKTQEFTAIGNGQNCDASILFFNGTLDDNGEEYITIEYYENGATTPTKVKKLMLIPQD